MLTKEQVLALSLDELIIICNETLADPYARFPYIMENTPEFLDEVPYKLLIDDFITTEPGTATSDGPAVRVTLQVFGSFVVLDPSVNGVGIFSDATLANVLGYN